MADILPPPNEGATTHRPSICPTCRRFTDVPSSTASSATQRMATFVCRLGHSWTVAWIVSAD